MNLEEICFTCSNEGFYDKDCPECFKPKKSFKIKVLEPEKATALDETLDDILIPENYKHIVWDPNIFWSSRPDLIKLARSLGADTIPELEIILKKMDKVQELLSNGLLPKASSFVILPSGFSKSVWAFSCMRFALAAGLSVAPYLDTLEVASMLGASLENPNYKLYGNMTFAEYITKDVLFISVTKTEYRKKAYEIVRDILDKRRRLGRPTFILSEYYLSEIAAWDRTGNFLEAFNINRQKVDHYQFPHRLEYIPKRGVSIAK